MIVDNRKRALIKANSSDTSKLWALLRKTDNWGSKTSQLDCCGNVNDVNKYFTSVVCDKMYSKKAVLTELHSQLNADDANPAVEASYSDFDVMVILAKLRRQVDLMVFPTGCIANAPVNSLMCCQNL